MCLKYSTKLSHKGFDKMTSARYNSDRHTDRQNKPVLLAYKSIGNFAFLCFAA